MQPSSSEKHPKIPDELFLHLRQIRDGQVKTAVEERYGLRLERYTPMPPFVARLVSETRRSLPSFLNVAHRTTQANWSPSVIRERVRRMTDETMAKRMTVERNDGLHKLSKAQSETTSSR